MRIPKLELITGEAVKVQLTSETHVAGEPDRARKAPLSVSSHVVNRMRVFLKAEGGKERDFMFANSTVGVREGHRISVVRAKPPTLGKLVTVAIINHSTGQREEIPGAFARACEQKWIAARWRAIAFAAIAGLFYWIMSTLANFSFGGPFAGVLVALGGWPIFWALGSLTDALVLPARRRGAEQRVRAEMDSMLAKANAA